MNNQQARIDALLRDAFRETLHTDLVSLDTAAELAAEGYDLNNMERDLALISKDY